MVNLYIRIYTYSLNKPPCHLFCRLVVEVLGTERLGFGVLLVGMFQVSIHQDFKGIETY